MVLSEFVLTNTKGKSPIDWVYFADVSVTTESGALWWKKKHCVRRKITRHYAGFWHFVDNGQMCPGDQAEALERSYKAREALSDA
jgi:hypothetical protein